MTRIEMEIEANKIAAKHLTAIGQEVILILDDGTSFATKLKALPWQLGHGIWVAAVEGKSGGWDCLRILPKLSDLDIPGDGESEGA